VLEELQRLQTSFERHRDESLLVLGIQVGLFGDGDDLATVGSNGLHLHQPPRPGDRRRGLRADGSARGPGRGGDQCCRCPDWIVSRSDHSRRRPRNDQTDALPRYQTLLSRLDEQQRCVLLCGW